jgi:hypothetical protein
MSDWNKESVVPNSLKLLKKISRVHQGSLSIRENGTGAWIRDVKVLTCAVCKEPRPGACTPI